MCRGKIISPIFAMQATRPTASARVTPASPQSSSKIKPEPPKRNDPGRHPGVVLALLLIAVLITYANHFNNSFHFDDFHTVQENPSIRSLSNLTSYFSNASTFTIVSHNVSYRPLVTLSLALDYALGGGLNPFWFHFSTFLWFLVQLLLMYVLFHHTFERTQPDPRNSWIALFGVAVYGLHPACAETVNYIVQRGDLYVALGMVAAVVVYAIFRRARPFGLYLIPALAAMLAKPPALIFPLLLLAYVIFVDRPESPWRCARRAVPAFVLGGAFAVLERAMTPPQFVATTLPSFDYWITQPYVTLRYFRSFFVPLYLSADTDLRAFHSLWNLRTLAGIGFCGVLLALIAYTARRTAWRPAAFGLSWFLIGLVPTAAFPLNEMENDHRMFLPFVGLTLAVVWTSARLTGFWKAERLRRLAITVVSTLLLVALAFGTIRRNAVWHNDLTLWRDVTQKSPGNLRGWQGYGAALLANGEAEEAYRSFQRAQAIDPESGAIEAAMGLAAGALCKDDEAEMHFKRALRLDPFDFRSFDHYASWLMGHGRLGPAVLAYSAASQIIPAYAEPKYGLMEIFARSSNWTRLKLAADDVLRLAPTDPTALSYAALAGRHISPNESIASGSPTVQSLLDASLAYRLSGRYAESIALAHRILDLKPDSAEAYGQIAMADTSLGRWDESIDASRKALAMKQYFVPAVNSLTRSLNRKACAVKN